MNSFPSSRLDGTSQSAGKHWEVDPQSGQTCEFSEDSTPTPTPTNPSVSQPSQTFRVSERPDGPADGRYVIEQATEAGWQPIGWYADRVTADEIVAIATSDISGNPFDAARPDTALPFSALEGIEKWL